MPRFEGTVDKIIYRNGENGWTVASLAMDGSDQISVVGVMPFLQEGEHAVFEGEIVEHREYGRQIRAERYELTLPETRSAVEKYLASGLIRGIGRPTARLIVKAFGERTMEVLESHPERLMEIRGIGRKKAAMIADSFAEQNGIRMVLMFLQNLGISPQMSMKVYRQYGEATELAVRENPYRLADEIEGIGFQTADEIARSLGFAADCAERLSSGIRFVLSESAAANGHTWLPEDILCRETSRLLNAEEALVRQAMMSLILDGRLSTLQIDERTAVFLPAFLRAEREIALRLARLKKKIRRVSLSPDDLEDRISGFESENGISLCEEQRSAVRMAVADGLAVLTGGPGTGKTTTINCILSLMEDFGRTELCAPTGRAAKRMSEATGHEARTIHRMLEYGGDEAVFHKNEDDLLEADLVIVDEVSMVDIFLMQALLRALKPGCRVLFVGDADQLPSVGAGNVLKDMIASGVMPVVRLTEIFRQAQESMIVVNAHRINDGLYPVLRARDTDFFIEKRESVSDCVRSVLTLVRDRLPAYLGVDAMRDIQVMVPMRKGDLGVLALNQAIRQVLNPPSPQKGELKRGDEVFRLGDKVMQVRNDYDIEWFSPESNGSGVFNGDIGFIRSVDPEEGVMDVEFDEGRVAQYDQDMLKDLELAYCMSVHKSQGGEFPAVILPLLRGPRLLMTRNLLYTAITRARRLVVVVGREACLQEMVDNNQIRDRYSSLGWFLSGMRDSFV